MSKIDITITRTLTINTGNYQSIKPSVSMTVKDVDTDKVGDAYLALDSVLTNLVKLEIVNCASENKLVDAGLTSYCKRIADNQDTIGAEIEDDLNKLGQL